MEEMESKEIERKDIVRALENLFINGYTHLKMYDSGKVLMAFSANEDLIGEGDVAFHISLQELLEGFVEDSPMCPEDVKNLITCNPEGVRFADYLQTVADELYEKAE